MTLKKQNWTGNTEVKQCCLANFGRNLTNKHWSQFNQIFINLSSGQAVPLVLRQVVYVKNLVIIDTAVNFANYNHAKQK